MFSKSNNSGSRIIGTYRLIDAFRQHQTHASNHGFTNGWLERIPIISNVESPVKHAGTDGPVLQQKSCVVFDAAFRGFQVSYQPKVSQYTATLYNSNDSINI